MLKKLTTLFFVASALAFASIPAAAQMSDDAVIEYVKHGMATGTSQKEMARELVTRGVTQEQAERIKARYEEEQASQTEAAKVAGAQERQRRLNDGALSTDAGDIDAVSMEVADPGEKKIFGREIFTTRELSFAPSSNLPTPQNYVLGPGDEIFIDIWGANQANIRQVISPDGTINIPDLGLVNLNGMTVKEADSYMRRRLGQIYSVDGENAKSDIKLTLGNIRTIQVHVMGEVANPGTYYLSSLSNIYHALYSAGGVNNLGTLRDIQLIRKGKVIAHLDIYDFIREGKMIDTILEEGDIINVPTYEIVVDITGNIKRPMSYELVEGETIADLVDYAAGFTGDAYKKNLRMIRKNGSEYQIFTIDEPEYPDFKLVDGDAIAVGAMLDRFENKIEIKGAVYRPGTYQLGGDIRTVSQLIAKAEGLKGDAFTNRALITRERDDLTLEIIPVDIKAVLAGTVSDIELQKNDVLYIPSIHDLNDIGNITVSGEVAKPGAYVYADNMTLEDAIMLAGGLLESASMVKIDVGRRIKNPTTETPSETIGELFTFSFKDGYVLDGVVDFVLKPYDQIMVRRSPGYEEQKTVRVTGEVVFPGEYTLTKKEERLSDLVKKSGGLTQWAYVKGARLLRNVIGEEQTRMQSTIDLLDSAKDSINVENLDLKTNYFVGIDLSKALANPGGDADLVLRAGDVLGVPEYINTVRITGNVMYPNTVTYSPNMRVTDYVAQAGGYGYRSKKNKAYIIYLNGKIERARRFSKKVVEPGCEIVVPQKRTKDGQLQEILSISTTAASLGTMIATIGNLLR